MEPNVLLCPYCGEETELDIEDMEEDHQIFVQDCQICCRPLQIEVMFDREFGRNITLRREDE